MTERINNSHKLDKNNERMDNAQSWRAYHYTTTRNTIPNNTNFSDITNNISVMQGTVTGTVTQDKTQQHNHNILSPTPSHNILSPMKNYTTHKKSPIQNFANEKGVCCLRGKNFWFFCFYS